MDNFQIQKQIDIIKNSNSSVKEKYQALFILRGYNNDQSAQALVEVYPYLQSSNLLKHEVMYILGQMRNTSVLNFIIKTFHDDEENSVVRHEAGEAMSNFTQYKEQMIQELEKQKDNDISLIHSTVQIALKKLQNYDEDNNNYRQYLEFNTEPAEPFTEAQLLNFLIQIKDDGEDLLQTILRDDIHEFYKYRIMYTLRNRGDRQSVQILSELLLRKNRDKTSPLMRHELGFIMGQLMESAQYDFVKQALQQTFLDEEELAIARHEAIIAYNELFGFDEHINKMQSDSCPLVRESALICNQLN